MKLDLSEEEREKSLKSLKSGIIITIIACVLRLIIKLPQKEYTKPGKLGKISLFLFYSGLIIFFASLAYLVFP